MSVANSLHDAISANDMQALRQAISRGEDINQPTLSGITPLMLCIWHEFREGALTIMDAGADIHALDYDENNALLLAAFQGDSVILEKLVDAGANIRQVDESGDSAFVWAARSGLASGVLKLLDAGYPIDGQHGSLRSTALMEAMKHQHLEVGLALIEKGANTRLTDAEGHDVWHHTKAHQLDCLRAAAQANDIARKTPHRGVGRGGSPGSGRL